MKIRAYAATIASSALLAIAAPAVAAQNRDYAVANSGEQRPAQARAAASRANAQSERRICVNAEMTGSRLTNRICRTAAEWERMGGLPTDED